MKIQKIATLLLVCFITLFHKATAVVMLAPGTTLPGQAYIDYGVQFANSMVAIKRIAVTTGAVTYGSGVQIDERHVLTAAHVLDSTSGMRPVSKVFVVIGSNALNPVAEVGIRRYLVDPTYVVGSGLGTGTQRDWAIIELENPLPGRGVDFSQAIPNGVILSISGYGQPALPGNLQPFDGLIRAFRTIANDPISLFSNLIYNEGNTSSGSVVDLAGYGSIRDSGGGAFYMGKLAGISVASSGGANPFGATTYLDITTPDIQSRIAHFRSFSIAGSNGFQISSPVVLTATAIKGPRVSGKIDGGPGGKNVRIEVSRDLGQTDLWFTLGIVTLNNAGSGEFTNVPDDRPTSIGATSYYLRVVADP